MSGGDAVVLYDYEGVERGFVREKARCINVGTDSIKQLRGKLHFNVSRLQVGICESSRHSTEYEMDGPRAFAWGLIYVILIPFWVCHTDFPITALGSP
jgi:hypothetical protein